MNVYFISGLAADETVFKHILLPAFCKPIYLHWLPPLKNETLSQYAIRLSGSIDSAAPFALIGLSFGGMLASEIAKRLKPVRLILISSVPTITQLPDYFRLAGWLRLNQIIPVGLIKNVAILKRLFTTETAEDKVMLKAMIYKSDPEFIRWAINAVLKWRNIEIPGGLIQIHGTRDAILPKRFVKPTHIITGGGHLMVLNRAKDINPIIAEALLNNYV